MKVGLLITDGSKTVDGSEKDWEEFKWSEKIEITEITSSFPADVVIGFRTKTLQN